MSNKIDNCIFQYILKGKLYIIPQEAKNENENSLYIPDSDANDTCDSEVVNYIDDDDSLYNPSSCSNSSSYDDSEDENLNSSSYDDSEDVDSNSEDVDSNSEDVDSNSDGDSEIINGFKNILLEHRRRKAATIGLEKRRTSELEGQKQDLKFKKDMGCSLDRTTMKGKRRKESTRAIDDSDGEYDSEDDSEKREK